LLIYDDGSEVHLQNNEKNVQDLASLPFAQVTTAVEVSDTTGVEWSYKSRFQKQKPQTKTFPIFVIHQS